MRAALVPSSRRTVVVRSVHCYCLSSVLYALFGCGFALHRLTGQTVYNTLLARDLGYTKPTPLTLCPNSADTQYIAVLLSIATPHEGVIAQIIAVTSMMLALSTYTLLLTQSEV